MSLVARITALAQAVGADIKALSNNMMDLAGTRRMTGPVRFAAAPEVVLNNGQLDLAAATSNSVRGRIDGPVLDLGSLPAGEVRTVRFMGGGSTAKLVYSYASIRLPANADISLSEGDTAEFYSLAPGVWELRFFQRQDGTALVGTAAPVTSVAGKTGAVTLAKGDVGLGSVENTADANKPVSTAQQTALNLKVDKAGSVTSVAGRTGAVVLAKGDVGLGNVDNTADSAKPVSDAQATAIAAKTTLAETMAQMQSYGIGNTSLPRVPDTILAQTGGLYGYTAGALNRPNAPAGVLLAAPYSAGNTFQLAITNAGVYTRQQASTTVSATWEQLAPIASPALTGIPTTTTPAATDNSTRVQSTAGSLAQMQSFGLGQIRSGEASSGSVVPTPAALANTSATQFITVGGDTLTTDTATNHNPVSGETFAGLHVSAALRPKQFGVSGFGSGSTFWWRGNQGASPSFAEWRRASVHGAPTLLGQFTLATLPSASAYSGHLIDVTNATGGVKTCRSNGTNWLILNTTTIVS